MSSERTTSDVAFIRALADILKESDLAEIEIEREYGEDDELKVRLSRYSGVQVAAPVAAHAAPPLPGPPPQSEAAPATTGAIQAEAAPVAGPAAGSVPSPMVGTVYLSPEPGAAAFVSVGDRVTKGQTLLIIEAMKTMNQIPAPHDGTVSELLVADGEPVEYGSSLMVIV